MVSLAVGMSKSTIPNMVTPCAKCPFRKDALKGWLGEKRMKEILSQESFTCHKTDMGMQCAGHMLIKEEGNVFYKLAKRMGLLVLEGRELVFEKEEECIKHHKI